MEFNLIFDDENIIGYSAEVIKYISFVLANEIEPDDEDGKSIFTDLLLELGKHDELVLCQYHPMGAYSVFDLVTA